MDMEVVWEVCIEADRIVERFRPFPYHPRATSLSVLLDDPFCIFSPIQIES